MRRVLLLCTLLCLAAPAAASAESLDVLTLNVQGGTADDRREPDIQLLLADLIKAGAPDAIGLQEICDETIERGGLEGARIKELLFQAGYTWVHTSVKTVQVKRHEGDNTFRCHYGTGILVRGKIQNIRRPFELKPRDPGGEPRKVRCVRSELKKSGVFWFCNTHVATQDAKGGRINAGQLKSLTTWIRRRNGPVILTGDLNRRPDRDSPLGRQFDEIDPKNRATHSHGKLDYILFTPKHLARAGALVFEPPVRTDHDGLLGSLRVR